MLVVEPVNSINPNMVLKRRRYYHIKKKGIHAANYRAKDLKNRYKMCMFLFHNFFWKFHFNTWSQDRNISCYLHLKRNSMTYTTVESMYLLIVNSFIQQVIISYKSLIFL